MENKDPRVPSEKSDAGSKLSPEKSGSASDSIPAMLETFRERNEELQKQLNHTKAVASDNEKIWRHFVEIERILFRTRQLEHLVEELLREIKIRFQLDEIILFLSHPDLLDRVFPDISQDSEPIAEGTWILPLPVDMVHALFSDSLQPLLLSSEDIDELADFLPETSSSLQSGVLVPLWIHQILFGGLLLGSRNADRYQPKDGTDLLEQLGIKIALCMDNCLTYEKLKDFAVQDPRQTNLLNFFQIHSVLESEFRKARRSETPLSLLVIDLDFFQSMNGDGDTGSEVLRHVADLLYEIFSEDVVFIGRYGSDEFMVILPDTGETDAKEIASYLAHEIRRSPSSHENTAILIQATIGAATLNDRMKRPNDLLDAACTELYQLRMRRSRSFTTPIKGEG